jgi:hypothetical protein
MKATIIDVGPMESAGVSGYVVLDRMMPNAAT